VDSLFDPAARARTLERIGRLRPDANPQWGKLSAPGMLVHCRRPLLVAFGELRLKRGLPGLIFGGYAKRKYVLGGAPFGRNSPTDPAFLERDPGPFEQERVRLVEGIERFARPGAITVNVHPFFGPLTVSEWDTLMGKHLDHHLGQFGV
jgi:hypothetical protein